MDSSDEYRHLITDAFQLYSTRLKDESQMERINQKNFKIVEEIDNLDNSLDSVKEYYMKNIFSILDVNYKSEIPFENIGIFLAVLNFYKSDLKRGLDLLQDTYGVKLQSDSILNKETNMIDNLLSKFK